MRRTCHIATSNDDTEYSKFSVQCGRVFNAPYDQTFSFARPRDVVLLLDYIAVNNELCPDCFTPLMLLAACDL